MEPDSTSDIRFQRKPNSHDRAESSRAASIVGARRGGYHAEGLTVAGDAAMNPIVSGSFPCEVNGLSNRTGR